MNKNKMIKAIICIGLLSSLLGCGSSKGKEEFSKLADSVPEILLEDASFDLNFLFDKPKDFGIKKHLYSLDYVTYEQFKKSNDQFEEVVDSLEDYDYSSLTKDQQITYDLLAQEEDVDIALKSLYYLSTNYFDAGSGIQAQLPFSLWNYEFKNQKSLDSFLHVLKTSPTMFNKYVDFEKERQDKGYGMSQSYMDSVIENIHTINNTSQQYILDATYTKIDALTFLSNEEKQVYKDKVTNAFNESFLPAFQQVETSLQQVEVKTKKEGALKDYKDGKDYYASIVLSSSGFDSMKEYNEYLDEQEVKLLDALYEVIGEDHTLIDRIENENFLSEIAYTDIASTQEVMKSLESSINSGENFPKIKDLDYEMLQIPESMKETTTAAAMYFISAYDDYSGQGETMLFNGTFDQANYSTIAHEGFPGHMYAHNYFKSVDHHILRDLLGSNAYAEGWATYIEGEITSYAKAPTDAKFAYINSALSYISILRIDKQIHYDGTTKEKVLETFKKNFGIEDEEIAIDQYEMLLQNPGVFVNYHVGSYRILDLKEEAKEAWGKEYSDKKFHKAILDLGPLPLDLLETYMQKQF